MTRPTAEQVELRPGLVHLVVAGSTPRYGSDYMRPGYDVVLLPVMGPR